MTLNSTIMLHNKLNLLVALLLLSVYGTSLPYKQHVELKWKGIQNIQDQGLTIQRLLFEGAYFPDEEGLPHFLSKLKVHTGSAELNASLENAIYETVSVSENELLLDHNYTQNSIKLNSRLVSVRKEPAAYIDFIPIRWNPEINNFEKLVSADIIIDVIDKPEPPRSYKQYTNNSVLSSGQWFKIRLNENGIYKITYEELDAMGFDVSVTPSRIAVFGNGGGVLAEKNDEFRYDDLYENPILVIDGNDGSFDNGDYILFYGEGPVTWYYNTVNESFNHRTNYYKDYSYYFITAVNYDAKRVVKQQQPTGTPDTEINDFTDYVVHEIDERNIAGIGRTWFGEIFDYQTQYDFAFSFPNIKKTTESGYFRGHFASKAYSNNAFEIFINGNQIGGINIPNLNPGNRYEYAKAVESSLLFTPTSEQLVASIKFVRSSNGSVGYLDYFEINVERDLKFSGDQMMFRKYISDSEIAQYTLQNANGNIIIWDVTTPVNPYLVDASVQGNSLVFNAESSSLKQYIAFNGNSFLSAEFVEEVPNQNLHSIRNIDYLIVTHTDFLDEANRLADFHRDKTGIKVEVVTVNQIYNEFSSGGQDITAIRDMAKMLYDDSDSGRELKYLLLFGDASYDYKDILQDNTNFVPCWESRRSLDIVTSIASDDYFGFLDDGEGVENSNDLVDIGIGRFVVATPEEAAAAVDKTIHYSVNTTEVMEPWRNVVTFLADDGDGNRHLKDAERLAVIFDTSFRNYNVHKIYADAYEQISTPSGQAAPAVNKAINDIIAKGTLIFNYSGHGGEIGLGHERFLQVPDIQSWTNYDKLSVFITATCEFTRYDDPTRVSAGELVFLNPKGGAISLFTTSRATFAGSNLALNMAIYNNNMFEKIDGEYPTFGDIIRRSKLFGTANDKKFVLVGDPACRMAYPQHKAITTKINTHTVTTTDYDTIKALQLVHVEGEVTDQMGVKLDDFNGELFSSVYDKKNEIITFGDENPQYSFYVRNSIIFNGKSSIENGEFSFEFMVPKDIAYKYGDGRISYYFRDSNTDGSGYYENIVVGGYYEDAKVDNEGPVIELFIDDTTFVSGSTTNQNPKLLAFVSDSSGINTTGIGIGHDIISVINEDKEMAFVLNDYYEADKNKFNQGTITYPFSDLPEGNHTLSLKVWDVYNNSSIAYIDFKVVSAEEVIVSNLMNFPNPFMDKTSFVFDHNQAGNIIDVQLEIFNTSGSLVKRIITTLAPEGHQSEPIVWDGRKDNGGLLTRGFYVYRVTVRNEAGGIAKDASKLIYVR